MNCSGLHIHIEVKVGKGRGVVRGRVCVKIKCHRLGHNTG